MEDYMTVEEELARGDGDLMLDIECMRERINRTVDALDKKVREMESAVNNVTAFTEYAETQHYPNLGIRTTDGKTVSVSYAELGAVLQEKVLQDVLDLYKIQS